MKLTLRLAQTAIVAMLALAIPVGASILRDSGQSAHYDFLGARGGSTGTDAAACSASQCGLSDLRSAARAIALSAGARPGASSDRPAMTPDTMRRSIGNAMSSNVMSQGADMEPVAFALITPSNERTQLCIDDGNLLGMQTTCGRGAPTGPNSTYDCEHANPRLGMKIACRIGRDAPEPATPLLVGIALLGLAAARSLRIARKGRAASL
jgi:hypothetical protein